MQSLVDAEFDVLRALGATVCRTANLIGTDTIWSPALRVLLVGLELTAAEAQTVTCAVLGLLASG